MLPVKSLETHKELLNLLKDINMQKFQRPLKWQLGTELRAKPSLNQQLPRVQENCIKFILLSCRSQVKQKEKHRGVNLPKLIHPDLVL